jgi:hypothetical protein
MFRPGRTSGWLAVEQLQSHTMWELKDGKSPVIVEAVSKASYKMPVSVSRLKIIACIAEHVCPRPRINYLIRLKICLA